MKKFIYLFIFVGCTMFSAHESYGQKIVTAAQVNGTWQETSSDPRGITTKFLIYSLGKGQLKVEFSANNAAGKFSNTAIGTAAIEGTTATFQPPENNEENPCVMTLNFTGAKLSVEQTGECGWGRGVDASGTYKKISSKKPIFDKE